MSKKHLDVVVVGGSLGGLMTGLALKRAGHAIRILERNPTPLLKHQGAGIVAGWDTQAFFSRYDLTKRPIVVLSHQRPYLDKTGRVVRTEHYAQKMTSWDLLYYLLRANFDGVKSEYVEVVPEAEEGDGKGVYEYGKKVVDVREDGEGIQVQWECTKSAEDDLEQEKEGTISADMLIAADGPSSTMRGIFLPEVQRQYVNYIAWRGTVPESEASQSLLDTFVEKFAFYSPHSKTEGTQILAYTIPGPKGSLELGHRLINWVWYCTCIAPGPQWDEVFTDLDGAKHHFTLPIGKMKPEVWSKQKRIAKETLPPQFAELVDTTEFPFVQAITDVLSPQIEFMGGKVLLVGDAAAGFRPHTAASTSQAAFDAMKVAQMMRDGRREHHLQEMAEYARNMQRHGMMLGASIMPHLT